MLDYFNGRKVRYLNGYKLIYVPEHPSSMKTESWKFYIYEHEFVAEQIMGRTLRDNEQVHHLDQNRMNNNPDNLLILEDSQHTKLHFWIRNGMHIVNQQTDIDTVYCLNCELIVPVNGNKYYCSNSCRKEYQGKIRVKLKLERQEQKESARNARKNLKDTCKREANRKTPSQKNYTYGKIKYKGVVYDETRKKPYRAKIFVNGKYKTLGSYSTPEEAAKAFDKQSELIFGEQAITNKSLGLL